MKRACLAVFSLAVLVACSDRQPVTSPGGPMADFSDGRLSTGNKHFFFLPPLVSRPTFSGDFNPKLKPVVEICELGDVVVDGVHTTGCVATLTTLGPLVDVANQQYSVNWDTKQPAINVAKYYRIQVRGASNGTILGFADIDPVANGSQLKNVQTADYIGLVDGRTMPIKFRIERGAFTSGRDCTDCAEQTVGPAGGTVITNTNLAGAFFPAGALTRDVTVIIERDPTQPCIPVNLHQFPGCYTFSTDPGPTKFNTNVTAGICVETGELSAEEIRSLILYQLDVLDKRNVITPLENTPAAFLPCNSLARSQSRGSGLFGLALAGLDAIRSLVVPATLNAAHLGVGGLTGSFSRIGWGLPPTITEVGGTNDQTAAPDATVPNPPAVQLLNSSEEPVAGLPVKFKVTAGDGSIVLGNESLAESTVVTSNSDGIAAIVGWKLGPTAGATNRLEASQIGALGSPVTFRATATSGAIDFETYPDGEPACSRCSVTADFIDRGLQFDYETFDHVFTGATLGDGNGVNYGDASNLANHFLTSALTAQGAGISGVLTMTLSTPYPHAVSFDLSVPADVAAPINVFPAGSGTPLPESSISRTFLRSYTNVAGAPFNWYRIAVSSDAGIQRIVLIMTSYIQQIDNVVLTP